MGETSAVGLEEVRQGVKGGAISEVGLLLSGTEAGLELFLKSLAVVAMNINILSEVLEDLRSLATVELYSRSE